MLGEEGPTATKNYLIVVLLITALFSLILQLYCTSTENASWIFDFLFLLV